MSTISGTTITYGLVFGSAASSGTVTSPLTIAATGAVNVLGSGSALYGANTQAWAVDNYGTVTGGTSGAGIDLRGGGNIENFGLILGGKGVDDYYSDSGSGGAGIILLGGGIINNSGSIAGGDGGFGPGAAGTGGVGIYLLGGGIINNSGSIAGGNGGYGFGGSGTCGAAGAGVSLSGGGSIGNFGTIAGGKGAGGSYTDQVSSGGVGIDLSGGGNVDNSGLVFGGVGGYGAGAGGAGIYLSGGGSINNSGSIAGGQGGFGHYLRGGVGGAGIALSDGGGIDNSGFIAGGAARGNAGPLGGAGIYLYGSGSIANSGTIAGGAADGGYGGAGIYLLGNGSIGNFGTIAGGQSGYGVNGAGIVLSGDGIVTNGSLGATTALITGIIGIEAIGTAGATITNYATIIGSGGVAVSFGGGGANLLALGAGYHLTGVVQGSTAGSNTLQLLETAGTALTVNYNALGLTNFETVLFGTGGSAVLLVSNTSGALGVTISGFDATSEIIDLTGIGADGTITNSDTATDRVTVTGSLGSVTLQFDQIDGLALTTLGDGGAGTELAIACYRRGTLILTDRGERAIEELAIGDMVMTLSGEAKPIKWIGHRAYDGRFIRNNRQVLPVRISAGALAHGVPARDLWVSPEHALYVEGVLVQAMHLLNGAAITQPETADGVEYFHIELEDHDVIFADGASAETFADCDNRLMFQNSAQFAALYPQDDRPRWQFCAPRLEWEAAALTAIRASLLDRALGLGHALDTDPDLHLIVDGAVMRPEAIDGLVSRFRVPAGSNAVLLASRSTVPTEVTADARDGRRLGVALVGLVLSDADLRIEVSPGHAGLCDGFHPDEGTHRWTDGLGRLPAAWLCCFAAGFTLDVRLASTELPYRVSVGPTADNDHARPAAPPQRGRPRVSRALG